MPVLYILGVSPNDPGTIAIDAIKCIKKSKAVVNGADLRTEELIKCLNVPGQKYFKTSVDQHAVKLCKQLLLTGNDVSYISYGNPFIFSEIGKQLLDCAKAYSVRIVPMPSAIDGILCALAECVLENGLRIASPASLDAGIPLDSRIPTLLFHLDNYIKNKHLATRLQRQLLCYYPAEHPVRSILLMEKGKAKITSFQLKEIAHRLPKLQLQSSLFLPSIENCAKLATFSHL